MQANQLPNPQTAHSIPTVPQTWHMIRTDGRRRRTKIRRWRLIRAQAGSSMVLFGMLLVLVWLGISMLAPHDHLIAGMILLLILGAEAASAIAYLISDAMLRYIGAD